MVEFLAWYNEKDSTTMNNTVLITKYQSYDTLKSMTKILRLSALEYVFFFWRDFLRTNDQTKMMENILIIFKPKESKSKTLFFYSSSKGFLIPSSCCFKRDDSFTNHNTVVTRKTQALYLIHQRHHLGTLVYRPTR